MLVIGIELETFCMLDHCLSGTVFNSAYGNASVNDPSDGKVNVCMVPKKFPADSCGYLFEARGEPNRKVEQAIYSVLAEQFRIEAMLRKANTGNNSFLIASKVPYAPVSRRTISECLRNYTKGLVEFQNLYGFTEHRNRGRMRVAGLHISFTKPAEVVLHDKTTRIINQLFDYSSIFIALDKAFKKEIRETKRNPGFYEIKSDLRIEYRSLPNNVDLEKLYDVLSVLIA